MSDQETSPPNAFSASSAIVISGVEFIVDDLLRRVKALEILVIARYVGSKPSERFLCSMFSPAPAGPVPSGHL
jgi:hypothetical protein